jgi:hypothetical protein
MQFDLDAPQFPPQELLACVPGLGADMFKQWNQRRMVALSTGENIGRGKKPMYRGTDVIQVAAVHELTRQGLMTSKAGLAYRMVVMPRVIAWQTNFALLQPPYRRSVLFAIHPETDELWAKEFSEDGDQDPLDHPDAPDVLILFRTDRFILRMIERMQRVKAGQPAVAPAPQPTPLDQDLATLGYQGQLEQDDQGRRVMIGLTAEETVEYIALSNRLMQNRMSGDLSFDEKMAAQLRKEELQDKHEAAVAVLHDIPFDP